MGSSLAAKDYLFIAQNYRLLAQRLRDQAVNSYSAEIRLELESMARHYALRADGAEISQRQSASPHLETPVRPLPHIIK